MKLLDNYSKVGDNLSDFKKEVTDMVNRTITKKCYVSNSYVFYSICNITEDKITLFALNEKFIEIFNSFRFDLLKSKSFVFTVSKDYIVKNFSLKEAENLTVNTLLLVDENRKMVLISRDAYRTMLARVGLAGDSMLEPTLARNILIAQNFLEHDSLSTVVSRKNNLGYEKIMAILTDSYKKIPQNILIDIINEVENLETLKPMFYEITNRKTEIYLSLPNKEKEISDVYNLSDCVPGIYLATSDTGDCSIIARAFFKFGKSRVTASIGEFSRKHEGTISIEDVVKEINTKLFPRFFIIPKKLTDLMLVDIKNPEEALIGLLKYINLVKLIGKKNEIVVKEQLLSEIDTTVTYTGYDICMMALTISERIVNIKSDVKKKLESGIIKAVEYDFPDETKNPVAYLQD